MAAPKVLVLMGDGINCERETANAFNIAGAKSVTIHINDLLENPKKIKEYDLMALPGGFSFGDELGSGQILSMKIRYSMGDEFNRFVDDKKPILGICNGFQVLVKLGLLPYSHDRRVAALALNESGHFIDRWVTLRTDRKSVCKWTIDLPENEFRLPVRHGEGRIVFEQGREEEIYNDLKDRGMIPFSYVENFNGSYKNIAALCDETGLILGMMPHPEAYIFSATAERQSKNPVAKGSGIYLFENIVRFLNER